MPIAVSRLLRLEKISVDFSFARAAAIVRKNRYRFALQVAILEAAVRIEVGVLGEIDAEGAIYMVVLKNVVEIGYPFGRGITQNAGQIVRAI